MRSYDGWYHPAFHACDTAIPIVCTLYVQYGCQSTVGFGSTVCDGAAKLELTGSCAVEAAPVCFLSTRGFVTHVYTLVIFLLVLFGELSTHAQVQVQTIVRACSRRRPNN